ncbi:hypothetical protein [Treponema sp. R6D11]
MKTNQKILLVWAGFLVSSLIFAFYNGGNYGDGFAPAFVLGLFFFFIPAAILSIAFAIYDKFFERRK